jgi:hypothetical protein
MLLHPFCCLLTSGSTILVFVDKSKGYNLLYSRIEAFQQLKTTTFFFFVNVFSVLLNGVFCKRIYIYIYKSILKSSKSIFEIFLNKIK